MAWGDAGVSKRLLLSSGAQAWSAAGAVQNTYNIPQTGILRRIRLHHEASATVTPGTGSVAIDVQGPWNQYSRFILTPNAQAPIVNVSGFGLSLINELIAREGMGGTPDTAVVSQANTQTASDVYNFPLTGSVTDRYYQNLPVAQVVRSLGGEVGLFPLQNPAVQLALQFTPNTTSTSSPYTIGSTTAATLPYLLTGVATATIATPTLEIIRDMWEVPQNKADYPPFNFVSTWNEEQPVGANVVGATQVTWNATPLSGILVRVIGYVYDGGTSKGFETSTLTASNAVTLLYGSGTAKAAETGSAAVMRQRDELGHDMTLGAFFYDMLGANLTLQDSLNLFKVGNVQMQFNITAGLAAGSSAKFLRQLIQPLTVQA